MSWHSAPMAIWTLRDLEHAVRAAWAATPATQWMRATGTPANPARGQWGATALVLHDLLGGDLLIAEVRYVGGQRQGCQYWNRLAGGIEIDLTREQFTSGEMVNTPEAVTRLQRLPNRCRSQYLSLRRRVSPRLGVPVKPAIETGSAQRREFNDGLSCPYSHATMRYVREHKALLWSSATWSIWEKNCSWPGSSTPWTTPM